MRRLLRENGLSLVMFGLFFAFLVAHSLTGLADYNDARIEHGRAALGYLAYLGTGHFIESVFENWESEFLQMAGYVYLTIHLRQKGSSDSKSLTEREAVDEDPRAHRTKKDAPWPVRKGGLVLRLYEHSLGLAFVALFLVSFVGHAIGGAIMFAESEAEHGRPGRTFFDYVTGSTFWFESFQNWQSEFLAVASIVVLSIFLRHRGSPESKPVAAANDHTGK